MSVTSREQLVSSLSTYKTDFTEEAPFIEQFFQLLQSADAYGRHHLPGHITGSAWIVNPARDRVLLVHHVKLNKWLQPGGHADGDENIFRVALREAEEETGLKDLMPLREVFFDIDIHTIPARNDFPEHLHYDVRFIFQANEFNMLVPSSESHSVAWTRMEDLIRQTQGNKSIIRMLEKTSRLP